MRLYTFERESQARLGAELDGRLVDLSAAWTALAAINHGTATGFRAESMLELIRGGEAALAAARAALVYAANHPQQARAWTYELNQVKLHAPLPSPGKIFCSGLNYRSHVEENPEAKFLDDPRFFVKVSTAVIGPGEPIRWPGARFQVDYEVELAVVLGRVARRLTQKNALEHVFGYTILHDVSARWVQFKDRNEDMGKNFDTFAPMGPCLVTADEIPDPAKLKLSLKLNGKTMQERTNEDWCFPLPRLLEWLTMGITLQPGDVVSTGTPAGIGYFRKPQVFLKPGDVCELEISSIGRLINPVVADEF
jgi:2-keto-4-pentenoate hydratase/2-oxohepta-3-ene-1,7-dioic acid hydratase in catechol pathway